MIRIRKPNNKDEKSMKPELVIMYKVRLVYDNNSGTLKSAISDKSEDVD